MPWTPAQMVAKGARDGERAAKIANGLLATCIAAGGTDKTCAPKAIRIALTKVNWQRKG